MAFFPSIRTRRVGTVCSWFISRTRLLYRSRNIRFGRLTKFSICVISLCQKLRSRRRSSPSSSGRCFSSRLSRLSLSELMFLSEGLRYTTNTPGICGSSANIILSSSSTLRTIACYSRYLYLSSSSIPTYTFRISCGFPFSCLGLAFIDLPYGIKSLVLVLVLCILRAFGGTRDGGSGFVILLLPKREAKRPACRYPSRLFPELKELILNYKRKFGKSFIFLNFKNLSKLAQS